MIQPDDIRRKAENLYPEFLRAWLAGEAFFPREIRGSKRPEDDLVAAGESVRRLRNGSKEAQGYGYSVEWTERNSRTHGRNLFPRRIVFETQDDLLRFIGKRAEFAALAAAVEQVRRRYPQLLEWIGQHRKQMIESAGAVEGLLQVADYLCANPRPGLFARELPVPVDTKFVERHRGILREWLDRILPPETIRADEEHFERRYGLRYAEPHLLVRFLDPAVQQACGCPWPECSIPLSSLAATAMPVDRILIVENKVNLLTLPPVAATVALGGLGDGVSVLRDLRWLAERPIWYWGDLDVEGLAILSRLRSAFPHVRSVLMDAATLTQWKDRLASAGTGRTALTPANLTEPERAAFLWCAEENLRIEQERFPHAFVLEQLQTAIKGHEAVSKACSMAQR